MLWGSYSMVAKAVWWGTRLVTIVTSHCSVNNTHSAPTHFLLLLATSQLLDIDLPLSSLASLSMLLSLHA